MDFDSSTFIGLHPDELSLFRAWIGDQSGEAVEIGCMDGYSTAHILEMSRYHLTTIDPFIPDSCDPGLIGCTERFQRNLAPWSSRLTLIPDYSWNISPAWTTPLDFLFIDGDHKLESVRKDYDQWTPFLKTGGILAMHDARVYRPGGRSYWPGPSQVAMESVFGDPIRWSILGEAQALVLARKQC